MLRQYPILIIVTFFCFPAYSQNSIQDNLKNSFSLDSLLNITRDTSAYINKINLINRAELFVSDLSTAVLVFSKKKEDNYALLYAEAALKKGEDIDRIYFYLSPDGKSVLLKMEYELHNKYLTSLPDELFSTIIKIYRIETFTRKLNLENKFPDSTLNIIDTSYKNELISIINKYGFISERKYGALFYQFYFIATPCFVNTKEDYEFFKSYLLKELKAGNIKSEYYTYFVDQYYYYALKAGYQIYGSLGSPFTGLPLIKDIKNVDRLRREIGACSLKNWLILRKIPLKFLPNGYRH